jgi:hypothetical protein
MCDRQARLGEKAALLNLVHKWVNLIKLLIFNGVLKVF